MASRDGDNHEKTRPCPYSVRCPLLCRVARATGIRCVWRDHLEWGRQRQRILRLARAAPAEDRREVQEGRLQLPHPSRQRSYWRSARDLRKDHRHHGYGRSHDRPWPEQAEQEGARDPHQQGREGHHQRRRWHLHQEREDVECKRRHREQVSHHGRSHHGWLQYQQVGWHPS